MSRTERAANRLTEGPLKPKALRAPFGWLTARVRDEEGQWREGPLMFLDTRRSAHSGNGPASTFEFAVSAATSIGPHLAGSRQRFLIVLTGESSP